jgi:hypothetical protein
MGRAARNGIGDLPYRSTRDQNREGQFSMVLVLHRLIKYSLEIIEQKQMFTVSNAI